MKRYQSEIRELLSALREEDYKKVRLGAVKRRETTEFPMFLKSGLATSALVLSQFGTQVMYRMAKAAKTMTSTEAITPLAAVDKLLEVQKILDLENHWEARTFRRDDNWIVPRETWEDIFIGDGLAAVDKLIRTETLVIGKGNESKEGTMYYFPHNSLHVAGAARLICADLLKQTGDPIFNIRVVDRQVV